MGDNINPIKTLIEVGLTPNQAKLYLCLLKANTATGSVLSKETKFARQEVYRVLQELHDMGLVNKILANPTQFEAVPIQEGTSVLLSKKMIELEQTKEQVQDLVNEYCVEKQDSPTREYKFHLIPAKKLANETRERMFMKAKKTVFLTSTNRRLSQGVAYFFDVWEHMLKREVVVQVIVNGEESKFASPAKLKFFRQFPNFSCKFTSEPAAGLLVVDDNEAIVTLDPLMELGASPVLWTNHPEMLTIYKVYFQTLWGRT